jgi:uncharacterized protein YebE (UPF0316 family)
MQIHNISNAAGIFAYALGFGLVVAIAVGALLSAAALMGATVAMVVT